MVYTIDGPHFLQSKPEQAKAKTYTLSVQDREMLRRISAQRPLSDAQVQPAKPATKAAPVKDWRTICQEQFQRNRDIAASIKAAADEMWRRA
jgi:hypothetical protein